MRLIFTLFIIFIQAIPGTANSSGIGGACFADAIKLCTLSCPNDTPRPWAKQNDAGILSPCCPPGMDLVAPPTPNAAYSLTASQQVYNPGSIVTLSLDVLKKDFKYLGLLLYAVQDDGREIRVGTWTFPKTGSTKFWTPPTCNKKVVMHKHAGVKHIHHAFDFVAPPVGTGRIRFRVLIKHGETNGGSFFWPQADLTMKEGPSLVSSVWIRGDFGQTCAAACRDEGLSCDAQAMTDAIASKGKAQFGNASKFVPCARPHISNNGKSCDAGPLVTSDGGFCFYRDDDLCPPQKKVCEENTSKDRRRACACIRTTTTTTTTKPRASASDTTATTKMMTTQITTQTKTKTTTTAGNTASTKYNAKKPDTHTTTTTTTNEKSSTTTTTTATTTTTTTATTNTATSVTEPRISTATIVRDIDAPIEPSTSLRVGHSATEQAASSTTTHPLVRVTVTMIVVCMNMCVAT